MDGTPPFIYIHIYKIQKPFIIPLAGFRVFVFAPGVRCRAISALYPYSPVHHLGMVIKGLFQKLYSTCALAGPG
jgi:hypothetical protein